MKPDSDLMAEAERKPAASSRRTPHPERSRGPAIRRRAFPFLLVALFAEASPFLPPEPRFSYRWLISAILLVAVAGSALLPWVSIPRWLRALPPIVYVISVAFLVSAVGSTEITIVSLFLLPVVWAALYQRRRESIAVMVATAIVLVDISIGKHNPATLIAWGIALWAGLTVVIGLSIHGLRDRYGEVVASGKESARQADALSEAARRLATIREPTEVLVEASALLTDLLFPVGAMPLAALYFRVEDRTVYLDLPEEVDYDSIRSWPLAQDPYMSLAVQTGQPLSRQLEIDTVVPELQPALRALQITHCAWIPIVPNGLLTGVLTIYGQGVPIPDELFGRTIALAQIIQIALGNALTCQKLQAEAETDPLTDLANRRGFDLSLANLPGRRKFALLSFDVDHLKSVNDTYGHAAGDSLIVAVAEAARLSVRRADLVARLGGDEFLAFLGDANESQARRVANRLLTALQQVEIEQTPIRVSIGIACGSPASSLEEVAREADAAMYRAKAAGGGRYQVAPSTPSGQPLAAQV